MITNELIKEIENTVKDAAAALDWEQIKKEVRAELDAKEKPEKPLQYISIINGVFAGNVQAEGVRA